jgi:hypothetical protein
MSPRMRRCSPLKSSGALAHPFSLSVSMAGSPIRIKVLLPNRGFDLVAEAAMGGSIIKQYKMEVERAEKAKAAREEREAALAEARKNAESKEQSANRGGNDAEMSDVENSVSGASAAAGSSVHTAGATSSPLAQPVLSAATSSGPSSASVAPLPDMAASEEDPTSKNTIDTYENLRPVWHGQQKGKGRERKQHEVNGEPIPKRAADLLSIGIFFCLSRRHECLCASLRSSSRSREVCQEFQVGAQRARSLEQGARSHRAEDCPTVRTGVGQKHFRHGLCLSAQPASCFCHLSQLHRPQAGGVNTSNRRMLSRPFQYSPLFFTCSPNTIHLPLPQNMLLL